MLLMQAFTTDHFQTEPRKRNRCTAEHVFTRGGIPLYLEPELSFDEANPITISAAQHDPLQRNQV
jgi:hypothetical protein